MLKPGNAGVAALEVKIIDFGLAKAIADAGGKWDITHGEFVGTPNFASPEQFENGCGRCAFRYLFARRHALVCAYRENAICRPQH
jgi:serine/threonine protein kinase